MPAILDLDFTPDRVKSIRIHLGLTVQDFAAKLGVHPNTVTRWEKGQAVAERGPYVKALLDAEAEAQEANGG